MSDNTHFEVWNVNEEGRHEYGGFRVPNHEARYDIRAAIECVDWSQSPVKIHTFKARGKRRGRVVQFTAGLDVVERGYRQHTTFWHCEECRQVFPAPHLSTCKFATPADARKGAASGE